MCTEAVDCMEKFVEYIEQESIRLPSLFPQKPMIPLTDIEQAEYSNQRMNVIYAESRLMILKTGKLRDHCHYTGLYRGPAHNNCNLRYQIPNFIPIIAHNLSGYDAHLFIKQLAERFSTDEIQVIAKDKEDYISFSVKIKVPLSGVMNKNGEQVYKKIELRFLDSYRFMPSSLDRLSANLTDDQCKGLKQFYGENFKLMRRKGVYPYEYMDSFERFNETCLPPKEAFYSELTMSGVSDIDYEYAKQIWNMITPEGDSNNTR